MLVAISRWALPTICGIKNLSLVDNAHPTKLKDFVFGVEVNDLYWSFDSAQDDKGVVYLRALRASARNFLSYYQGGHCPPSTVLKRHLRCRPMVGNVHPTKLKDLVFSVESMTWKDPSAPLRMIKVLFLSARFASLRENFLSY